MPLCFQTVLAANSYDAGFENQFCCLVRQLTSAGLTISRRSATERPPKGCTNTSKEDISLWLLQPHLILLPPPEETSGALGAAGETELHPSPTTMCSTASAPCRCFLPCYHVRLTSTRVLPTHQPQFPTSWPCEHLGPCFQMRDWRLDKVFKVPPFK